MKKKPRNFEELALEYHERNPPGKLAIRYTKPLDTQEDLSVAYSPGVAGPCRKIHENPDDSFRYTGRANLVGVISNGTAVLGLGNIGPYAAKPVMEGKGMLFKKFADIDVFDLEIHQEDPDRFIEAVKSLEPTFGGINLEDIKAPECFYIEEQLQKCMQIPVFHDDQHGTAIIASAAFLNALEITHRDIATTKVVFSGAGAAAIACANLFRTLGVRPENLWMCDSQGVIHTDRNDLNPYKKKFARDTPMRTLGDALDGADVFCGVSSAGLLTPDMLLKMAANPVIFALANPDPEIKPELAKKTRPDAIIATGRSDYPNQVNNVLGFPYIFRGALDVRAKTINEAMKLAAVHAIAALAKEPVPEEVMAVYKTSDRYEFGRDYLIPKPVDQRVLLRVAPAVAKAAMDSGVARVHVDMEEYQERIERLLGPTRRMIRTLRKEISVSMGETHRKPRVVLPYGEDPRILQAAKQALDGGDVEIVLLGDARKIAEVGGQNGIECLAGIQIIDPMQNEREAVYSEHLFEWRKRKGVSRTRAHQVVLNHDYFAAIMLRLGEVDALVTGVTNTYANSARPVLEILGPGRDKTLAGVYILASEEKEYFFADCTINVEPTAEQLADIAVLTADIAKKYTRAPVRVAMLSFTSFGASTEASTLRMKQATDLAKARMPDVEIDGEMQADVALNPSLRKQEFPFCELTGNANVLIFPNLHAANIAYKLLTNIADFTPTGSILAGLNQPANILQRGASVQEIVNMIYVSAQQAVKNKRG